MTEDCQLKHGPKGAQHASGKSCHICLMSVPWLVGEISTVYVTNHQLEIIIFFTFTYEPF